MTDVDVVERFVAIVGVGRYYGSRVRRVGEKPLYEWAAQDSTEVIALIDLLSPWFGERRSAKAAEVRAVAVEIRPHNEKKTHCPKGHPYSGDNLLIEKISRSSGEYEARRCRTCRRARDNARKRAVATI